MEKEKIKCDYCGKISKELRGTPYIADIEISKNGMCRECWDGLDENEIGKFDNN